MHRSEAMPSLLLIGTRFVDARQRKKHKRAIDPLEHYPINADEKKLQLMTNYEAFKGE